VTDRDLLVHTLSPLKAHLDAFATRGLEIDKSACHKKMLSG